MAWEEYSPTVVVHDRGQIRMLSSEVDECETVFSVLEQHVGHSIMSSGQSGRKSFFMIDGDYENTTHEWTVWSWKGEGWKRLSHDLSQTKVEESTDYMWKLTVRGSITPPALTWDDYWFLYYRDQYGRLQDCGILNRVVLSPDAQFENEIVCEIEYSFRVSVRVKIEVEGFYSLVSEDIIDLAPLNGSANITLFAENPPIVGNYSLTSSISTSIIAYDDIPLTDPLSWKGESISRQVDVRDSQQKTQMNYYNYEMDVNESGLTSAYTGEGYNFSLPMRNASEMTLSLLLSMVENDNNFSWSQEDETLRYELSQSVNRSFSAGELTVNGTALDFLQMDEELMRLNESLLAGIEIEGDVPDYVVIRFTWMFNDPVLMHQCTFFEFTIGYYEQEAFSWVGYRQMLTCHYFIE